MNDLPNIPHLRGPDACPMCGTPTRLTLCNTCWVKTEIMQAKYPQPIGQIEPSGVIALRARQEAQS
jgi:hypothetical protein